MSEINVAASSKVRDGFAALRFPFIVVSVLPFLAGSLLAESWRWPYFLMGLWMVVFSHLSANVMNDYADSRSGADWIDRSHYGMFGGSKLIQDGRLGEGFTLRLSIALAVFGAVPAVILTVITGDPVIPSIYLAVVALGWFYTLPPVKFSYRTLGEPVIFLMCGPAVVVGGWYLQAGEISAFAPWALSVLFGFLIVAALFMNQAPDLPEDVSVGKRTLVALAGAGRAWLIYSAFIVGVYGSLVFCYLTGVVGLIALASIVFAPLAVWSARRLAAERGDKIKLLSACRATLMFYTVVSLCVILDRIFIVG